jgi:transcriptional regulator with PAS, ATPase and Fis domain
MAPIFDWDDAAALELPLRPTPVAQRRDVPSRREPDRASERLVGISRSIHGVREQIERVAGTASSVLITGESGTGKELVARAIHDGGARRSQPFVAVNCAAIPATLIESQLFGHTKGAFTGAVQSHPGFFRLAHGGTLFLDEIGELPLALQVKLLRVTENQEVWPVGGARPIPVDVRIIAATNRDIAAEVASGRFRSDLYYRLNIVSVVVPPLRAHPEDIPALVDHLIRRLNTRLGRNFTGVEADVMEILMHAEWPGNVRQLENVVERAMVLGEPPLIRSADLPDDLPRLPARPSTLRDAVRRFQRDHILRVTELCSDKRQAARRLGISMPSLYRKLADHPDDVDAGLDGMAVEESS